MTLWLIGLLLASVILLGLAVRGRLDAWGERLSTFIDRCWNEAPMGPLGESILLAPCLGTLLGFLLRHDDRFVSTYPHGTALMPAMTCSLLLIAFVLIRLWRVDRWLAETESCTPHAFAVWRKKEYRRNAIFSGIAGLALVIAKRKLGVSEPFALAGIMAAMALDGRISLLAQEAIEERASHHRHEAIVQEHRANALNDQALRAKLAPHFIFNTLNTLKAQIAVDPRNAEATTDRLASLFRQVVQVADQPTIPLKQELAFVEAYLGIEQARLGDRLTVVLDIPEDLDDHPVPPLALQVLVENAIKHGIAPFEQPGTVTIQAEATPQGLSLSVTDTGTGTGAEPGTGTALATLRQRLAKPEDLVLERLETGFRASIIWRT